MSNKEIKITIDDNGAYHLITNNFSVEEIMYSTGVLLHSAYSSAVEGDCVNPFKKYMSKIIDDVYNGDFVRTEEEKPDSNKSSAPKDVSMWEFLKAYADKYGISMENLSKMISEAGETAKALKKLMEGAEDEEDT